MSREGELNTFMFNLFINNKKMKKTTVMRAYEAPEVNVESINVEKGFALSGTGSFGDGRPDELPSPF